MNLANITIVLVEPQGALNIGSVCRAMANFAVGDLRLVRPQVDYLGDEARKMAVKAADRLQDAGLFDDLAEALADCQLVLGTTRRFGKYREDFLHPDEAARELLPLTSHGRVAMVFGREDKGLLTKELDLCQRLVTIPTAEELPSMNLAQAVTICLYEVVKAAGQAEATEGGRKLLAKTAQLEALYKHMQQTLLDIDYLDPQNPEHITRAFRRIFGRAGLNAREVRILHGLWSRIDWTEAERRKSLGKDDE